ncbi:MAG TPA: thiamine-phosphate kinase [Thermoanaerobaculia bacterium]|nr:thiamine-phosphate kinase [Thermoanaerobaculia bacterium]
MVERLRALLPPSGSVLWGPGDDAALIDRPAGLFAATTDLLVEQVDFLPGEDPERLGRRAAAVNLSDLAAVGAAPEAFLLGIAFPPERGEEFPVSLARGAAARAEPFGARLVGGDLSSAPLVVVAVAMWGRPAAAPLSRSGARPGDRVYLSGHPGEAAAGLRLARILAAFSKQGSEPTPRFPELTPEHQRRLLDRYHDPEPRVILGIALAGAGVASAAIDVSDGLGVDAGRLARASGVRLTLEADRLPLSAALRAFASMADQDALELALSGGDDYELLFTVPEDREAALEELAASAGAPLTRIGSVTAGSGAVVRGPSGERDVAALGHDHLEAGA